MFYFLYSIFSSCLASRQRVSGKRDRAFFNACSNKGYCLVLIGVLISFGLEADTQIVKPISVKENTEVNKTADSFKNSAAGTINNHEWHKDRIVKTGEPEPAPDATLRRVALPQESYISIESVFAGRMARPSAYQFGLAREKLIGTPPYSEPSVEVFYEDVLDSVRDTIGAATYSKILWTYYDIKEIDNLIYAKMAQYDFSHSIFSDGYRGIDGLNHQFGASIMVSNASGAPNRNSMFQDDLDKPSPGSSGKAVLNIPEQNFGNLEHEFVGNSYFGLILRIMTVKNIIYAMLAIFMSGLIWRVFRFFIKQDLS